MSGEQRQQQIDDWKKHAIASFEQGFEPLAWVKMPSKGGSYVWLQPMEVAG